MGLVRSLRSTATPQVGRVGMSAPLFRVRLVTTQASLIDQQAPDRSPQAPGGSPSSGDPPPGAARAWVRDMVDGQVVEGIFAVRERELRQRRNGGEGVRPLLGDPFGPPAAG